MNTTELCVNCKQNNSCTMCWKASKKKCPHFIQKTNADRIRAMTDEELADFIGGIFTIERDMWGDYDPRTVVTQEPRVEVRNKEDMLDWLKQPVE